jgi:hypothetical protein
MLPYVIQETNASVIDSDPRRMLDIVVNLCTSFTLMASGEDNGLDFGLY